MQRRPTDEAFAELMHPAALTDFRRMFREIVALEGVAELRKSFFGVETVAEFDALTDAGTLEALMKGLATNVPGVAEALGYGIHLLNGWAFALLYCAAFETYGEAGVLLGALIGFVHAAFVLIVGMPALPAFHPRMASETWGPEPARQLEPPGNLALNYGWSTPVITLVAHVVFGAILGIFYTV